MKPDQARYNADSGIWGIAPAGPVGLLHSDRTDTWEYGMQVRGSKCKHGRMCLHMVRG